jgi:hypothetical protein
MKLQYSEIAFYGQLDNQDLISHKPSQLGLRFGQKHSSLFVQNTSIKSILDLILALSWELLK